MGIVRVEIFPGEIFLEPLKLSYLISEILNTQFWCIWKEHLNSIYPFNLRIHSHDKVFLKKEVIVILLFHPRQDRRFYHIESI